jgi:hypothetical protein
MIAYIFLSPLPDGVLTLCYRLVTLIKLKSLGIVTTRSTGYKNDSVYEKQALEVILEMFLF